MILKIEFLAKNKLLQQCVQILAQIPLKSPCLKDSRSIHFIVTLETPEIQHIQFEKIHILKLF